MGLFRKNRSRTPKPREGSDPERAAVDSGGESPIVHIDSRTFFDETAHGFTLVDFWAPWCAPCIQFAPAFETLAKEYEGRIRFGKVNVDHSPDIAAMLQIRSIPTLVVFDPDGNEAARFAGIPPRPDLTRILDEVGG